MYEVNVKKRRIVAMVFGSRCCGGMKILMCWMMFEYLFYVIRLMSRGVRVM